MMNPTTLQAVTELDDRLLVLTRSQARLTWVLRGLRAAPPEAVPAPATVAGTVPPVGVPRHMLRVTPPQRPHRPTKRNYDYFERLRNQLADLPGDGNGAPPQ